MSFVRSIAVFVSLLGSLLVSCSSSSPEEQENPTASVTQALTFSESVLGFEKIADGAWTATPTGSVLELDDRHTDGEHSAKLSVGSSQNFTLTSALVSGPASATDKLWLDVWIPSGAYSWRGSMNGFIESASCNAYSVFIGSVTFEYAASVHGYDKFIRLAFPLTGYPQFVASCAKNDLKITFQGAAPEASYLLFDRIYLGQSTAPTTLPTNYSVEIDLPVDISMSDVAAHASGTLRINDRTKIYAPNGYAKVSNSGDGQTILGADSETGSVFSLPKVTLRSRSKVTGSILSGSTIEAQDSTNTVTGLKQAGVNLKPLNKVKWTVAVPSETLPGFALEPGTKKTTAISPGHYGITNLKNDTKLIVGSGTYYFDQLYIDKGSEFEIQNGSGAVVIYVLDSLILRGTVARIANVPNVMFVYLGSMAASIDTSFPATFVAAKADAILEAGRTLNGAIFGKNVELHQGSVTNHKSFTRTDCGSASSTCESLPGCPLPDADKDGLADCDEQSDGLIWTDANIFNGTRQRLFEPCHSSDLNNGRIDSVAEVTECTARQPLETVNQYSGWNWASPGTASSCEKQFGFSTPWTVCRNDWMVHSEGFVRVENSARYCFALQGGTENSAGALFIENQTDVATLGDSAKCFTLPKGVHRISWLYERIGTAAQSFSILYCNDGQTDCVPDRILSQRELRVSYSSSDAVCDNKSSCSELCPCSNGNGTCSTNAQCQSGSVCGTGNGAFYGWSVDTAVCWPETCVQDTNNSGCSRTIRECATTADCAAGEVCGQNNAINYKNIYEKVCWPESCETDPNGSGCGNLLSPCGLCACTPNCQNKKCGDAPSDGCGGLCEGYCATGSPGCTTNLECASGSVCVVGGAKYFGGSEKASACMPKSCMETPPEKRDCGAVDSTCGSVCEKCVAECNGRECGPDPKCGTSCGECDSGNFCNASGLCEAKSTNPIPQAPPPSIVTPTEAGTIAGAFSVTSTGQAHYSIPLIVPPGVNGLAPQFSLEYDSSAGSSNWGVGWQLSGVSSIRRCPHTYALGGAAPIDFSDDDQYCLDGAPLVQIGYKDGRRLYRTEVDSFTKIWSIENTESYVPYVGPKMFEAETPDGRRLVFGNPDDSNGNTGAVEGFGNGVGARTSWPLHSVTDSFGNSIAYYYGYEWTCNGAGDNQTVPGYPDKDISFFICGYEPFLTYVAYGGNDKFRHNRSVKFDYDDVDYTASAPTVRRAWRSGVPLTHDLRYARITTSFEDVEVRNYRFGYDTDVRVMHLAAIQECHGDACKPATTFEYSPVPEFNASKVTNVSPPTIGDSKTYLSAIVGRLDANGDGIEDFLINPVRDVRNGLDCNETTWMLAIATGQKSTPYKFVPFETSFSHCRHTETNDIDGDGRWEVYASAYGYKDPGTSIIRYSTAGTIIETPYSTTTTVKTPLVSYDDDGDGIPIIENAPYIIDLDSDGVREKVDLWGWSLLGIELEELTLEDIEKDSYARKMKSELRDCGDLECKLSYCSNGDCDATNECWAEIFSGGTPEANVCYEYQRYKAADWAGGLKALDANGDGLQDYVEWHPGVGKWLQFKVLENTGRDQFLAGYAPHFPSSEVAVIVLSGALPTAKSFRQSFVYDTDRDGRDELIFAQPNGQLIRVPLRLDADKSDINTRITNLGQVGEIGDYDQFLVTDVDGDGVSDVLYGDDSWHVLYQNGTVSNRLSKITDGLGRVDGVSYGAGKSVPYHQTLTQIDSPHTTPIKTSPPVVLGHGVMATTQSGTITQYSEAFSYADARLGRYGRGALGFGEVTKKVTADVGDQYTETTTYDVSTYIEKVGSGFVPGGNVKHLYPFAGKPKTRIRTYENVPIGVGDEQEVGTVTETETWSWALKDSDVQRPFVYLENESIKRTESVEGGPQRYISDSYTSHSVNQYGAETATIHGVASASRQVIEVTNVTKLYEFFSPDGAIWARRLPTKITTESKAGGEESSIVEDLTYYDTGALAERFVGRVTAALTRRSQPFYNDRGNIIAQWESSGSTIRKNKFIYDSRGEFAETTTNAAGHSTTDSYYKGYGVPAVHEDINGLTSKTGIDGFGRIVSLVDIQGNETTVQYQAIDKNGPDFLDGRARFVETRKQSGSPEGRSYFDALGRKIGTEEVFANGSVRRTAAGYFGNGKKAWNTARPFFGKALPQQLSTYQYDSTGRLLSTSWPNDYANSGVSTAVTSYDEPMNWPNDEVGSETLGAASVVVRSEYPGGIVETELLDPIGRRLARIDAAGATSVFRYGPLGKLREVRDAAGLTYEMAWDALGRIVATKDPVRGNGTVKYSSGLSEEVTTTSNAGTIKRSSDVLGRPVTEVTPEGTSTWTYDSGPNAIGQVVSVTGPASEISPDGTVISYTYGPSTGKVGSRGKVKSVTRRIDGEDFALGLNYDDLGRLIETEYPSAGGTPFKVKVDYGVDGDVSRVYDGVATTDAEEYWRLVLRTPMRELKTEALANGVTTTYTYSPLIGKTMSVVHLLAGEAIGKGTIAYNEAGSVETLGLWENGVPSDSSRIFEYDAAGRLKNAYAASFNSVDWVKGSRTLGIELDPLGNVSKKSDIGVYEYKTSGNPYAVSTAGGNSYKYDTLGRQYWRSGPGINGGLQTINYASFGQPLSITTGQDDVSKFAYDALRDLVISEHGTKRTVHVGNLYQRTSDSSEPGVYTHVYTVQVGARTVAEVVAHEQSGTLVGNKEVRAIIADHIGSSAMSVGANSDIARSHFDEFGRSLDALSSRTETAFAGYKATANSGLLRMGVRMYDPVLGRVLSPDGIIGIEAGQDGLNPYVYALNRPTRYIDSSGYWPETPDWEGMAEGLVSLASEVVITGATMGLLSPSIMEPLSYALTHTEECYPGDWLFQTAAGDQFLANAQMVALGTGVVFGVGAASIGVMSFGIGMVAESAMAEVSTVSAIEFGAAISEGAATLEAAVPAGVAVSDVAMTVSLSETGALIFGTVGAAGSQIAGVAQNITANSAYNVANGSRLAADLVYQEASSTFTTEGWLHPETIASAQSIIPGSQLNPALQANLTADGSAIANWAKYTTQSIVSPSGPYQVHFYYNFVDDYANYMYDYKAVFNNNGVWP